MLIDRELDAAKGVGNQEVEGLSKKENGLMDRNNTVVIPGGGDIRGVKGDGRKYNKD